MAPESLIEVVLRRSDLEPADRPACARPINATDPPSDRRNPGPGWSIIDDPFRAGRAAPPRSLERALAFPSADQLRRLPRNSPPAAGG